MSPVPRLVFALIAAPFVLAQALVAADESPALKISVPAGWKISHTGGAFYSVKKDAEDFGELMIMMVFPMVSKEQISSELDKRVSEFVAGLNNATDWKTELDSDKYSLTKIAGEEFSGYYAKFGMPIDQLTAMFLISSEEQTWWLHYSGAATNWSEAVSIVKGLRKQR